MEKYKTNSSFWRRIVYILECNTCGEQISKRGKKAVLLSDRRIELFSTDSPDFRAVGVIPEVFTLALCDCKMKSIGCLSCGNVVGYHIMKPCKSCINSGNNGHFWIFYYDSVLSCGRLNAGDDGYVLWKELPSAEEDEGIECLR